MSEYITDPELLKKLNSSSEKKSDEYITDPDLLSKLNSETKPESRMPKPVEGAGGAAFGVYRPAGRRPESQQDREASKDMPVQTARGIASNVLMGATAPVSVPSSIINTIANAPRTAQDIANRYQSVRSQLAGNERQPLPELPEYNKVAPYDLGWAASLTPGPEPISPAGQLAFGAGQLVGAPIMPKSVPTIQNIKTGAEAVKSAGKAAGQFAEGAGGVYSGAIAKPGKTPDVWQKPSSRIVAEETHYPADLQEAWRKGEISTEEMNKGRVEWTPEQRAALEKTQGHVPVEGQVARAAGEQFMAPHMSFKGWIPEIAAASLGGLAAGPLGGLAAGAGALGLKGYQAYKNAQQIGAFNELGRVGFTPQTIAEMEALRTGNMHPVAGPQRAAMGLQANMPPSTPALPAPVAPQSMSMPGPQRNVNIEGQSYTLPQQIDVSNSQAARPQPVLPVVPKGTPAQVSQQIAAQKLTQNVQPQPTVAQPVVPEGMQPLSSERFTDQERLTVAQMLERMRKQKAEGTPTVEKQQTPAQMEREQKKMAEAAKTGFNESVIDDFATTGNSDKIDMFTQTIPIDVSKAVYNESNATRGMADWLLKHNVDSIPVLEGMTESQIVHALFKSMTGKGGKKVGAAPKSDLGTEVNLPKKETFDPNNSQQSYDELMGTTSMEKRYRGMSQDQLLKAEKDLNNVMNNPNAYPSDLNLAKQGLEFIRKYKK